MTPEEKRQYNIKYQNENRDELNRKKRERRKLPEVKAQISDYNKSYFNDPEKRKRINEKRRLRRLNRTSEQIQKTKEQQHQIYLKNIDKYKNKAKKYRINNPEKVSEINRNWRENNPERKKFNDSNWAKNNPERKLINNLRALERVITSLDDPKIKTVEQYRWALTAWSTLIYQRDEKCVWCGKTEDLEAAHIFPKGLYPKLSFHKNNGICLCYDCHIWLDTKVNTQRNFSPEIAGMLWVHNLYRI